jgi:ribonucleoside-diphosphate reductase alpha chain
VAIKDIGNIFQNETNSAFSRVLSLSLRHGAPVQYVVEQLIKGSDKESDLFSYSKGMSRVLKNYIKDGTKTSQKKCEVCDSTNLAFQQGCVTCLNCGNSKCS